jgi:hypothetical protein
MAKQVSKVLQVTCPEVTPEVTPNVVPEVKSETIMLNLFDIDPNPELKSRQHIDLDLDQLEDSEE